HGADRVEERFGLEGTRREAGEEARLERSERASDFRARRRRRKRAPRERARESDASNERAQPKAIADEVACEGIEKRGMACGIRRPEISDGLDEAATEKLGPDAVHHRAREKEMVGRDEPIGEGDARIVVRVRIEKTHARDSRASCAAGLWMGHLATLSDAHDPPPLEAGE